MTDERGQALIFAVVVIAFAALVIGGLRLAQDGIVAADRERRAYEAAVEGAAAVVADAIAASADPTSDAVLADARAAARALAATNGAAAIADITVSCGTRWTEVRLVAHGIAYRAAIEAACLPR